MPDMSGRELARTLRDRMPSLKIIYMTGYSDEVIGPVMGLKLDGPVLRKPFDGEAVSRVIDELMGHRAQGPVA
jgi:DNA-binding response OmpR family regulator